ncbi:MAG: hypothetical protein ACQESX_08215 [Bacteroidota bacterium]
MNIKIPLITGLILIATGFILKMLGNNPLWGNMLIAAGIISKIIFLIITLRAKAYKPGIEAIFLLAGLLIFLTGMTLRELTASDCTGSVFLASGITLKLVFIMMFFQKFKTNNHV